MTLRTKIIIYCLAGVLLALGVLTYRRSHDHQSCDACQSGRSITSHSFLGVPISKSEELDHSASVGSAHVHSWRSDSRFASSWFGTTSECIPLVVERTG